MDFYGTLGPSCCKQEVLYGMFQAGMTGVRLNLSHKPLVACEDWVKALQEAGRQAGIKPQLLIDLQGPELRVGVFAQPLLLEEGQVYPISAIQPPACTLPYLGSGQQMLLDDGKILGEILPSCSDILIRRGGMLASRKSMALPGLTIPAPTLTEADLENLQAATEYGVTGVMLPFVRGPQDLHVLRTALDEAGCGHIRIYAKLENLEGVSMLQQLLPFADEIVIARGDLGNAMDLWQLPAVQKQIAQSCRQAQKPFMVVTQMLASMEHAAVPTRAEVSDIFNAVLDGAASVMVTGETAVGEYPVETITYLVRTAKEALVYQSRMAHCRYHQE